MLKSPLFYKISKDFKGKLEPFICEEYQKIASQQWQDNQVLLDTI